jgi:Cu+-exporting ATPase
MFKSFFNKFKKDPVSKPPRDPVCGMRASDGITLVYKGQDYFFCSDHCKQQFEKDPESYISK